MILSPVITEKATKLSEVNQVVFRVTLDATKPPIAKAVEALFKVKVKAVNTQLHEGQDQGVRAAGRTSAAIIKKAIVTLAEGQQIDMTTGSVRWR